MSKPDPTTFQSDRCVLTRHDVQSIKDLIFVLNDNAESSVQKAIFEILANNMRSSHTIVTTSTKGDKAMPLGEPFAPVEPEWLVKAHAGIKTTTDIPRIIPPLPEGDTVDLKTWKEYWKQHDAAIRDATLESIQKWRSVMEVKGKHGKTTIEMAWLEESVFLNSLRSTKGGEQG
jgi:hypothetical protein